ncbi:hypothetical protein [Anaerosporobacter sp.]
MALFKNDNKNGNSNGSGNNGNQSQYEINSGSEERGIYENYQPRVTSLGSPQSEDIDEDDE